MNKQPKKSTAKEINDENLGTCQELFSAKSTVEGQDGGIVTSLLISGLEKSMFNVVVAAKRKEDVYNAEAASADSIEDITAVKGTKYVKVATASKLRQLIEQGHSKIAVVGTPCEVQVARKLQTLKTKAPNVELTIIGLFCFEAFNPNRLKTVIQEKFGTDIDKAEKTEIRHGKFAAHLNGKQYTCNMRELHAAAEESCQFCNDFTATQADVSVGCAGSQTGYSTVIVRTEKGAKLLEGLEIDRKPVEKTEIAKLCRFKKERAQKATLNLPAKRPN